MITDFIVKYNIPTYLTQIVTTLPAQAQNVVNIGKNMPTNVGLIYGIFVYTDNVLPTDASQDLISGADAEGIYMSLKVGNTLYIENLRLDHLIFFNKNLGAVNNTTRYMPVNIPYNIELDKSQYFNPSGVISKTILLNLLYIDMVGLKLLQEKKILSK